MTYVVLDIETTGLSRHYHKITEIAAVLMDEGKIIDQFETLVNPGVKIPHFITHLTGISDEMVKDAPKIERAMPEFAEFLGKNHIVAHNATFDYGFLNFNSQKLLQKQLKNGVICTRKLANRLVPDLPSKKLSALCQHFSITNIQAHRAMADVKATAEVFNNFCAMLDKKGYTTPNDIVKYQKTPRYKLLSMESKLQETVMTPVSIPAIIQNINNAN